MAQRKAPQNIDAEMAVLGAAFLTKDAEDKVCEELRKEMFFLESHGHIFDAIFELHNEGIPLDITTVSDKLEKNKTINNMGGIEYLTEVINSVATASNIDYYINIVREKYVLRSLIDVSTGIITDVYESTDPLNEILDRSDREFSNVIKSRKSGEFVSIGEIIRKVQDNLERLAKNKSDITGLATGFYDLDKLTSGLQPNELIIIAARPALGKTACGLNIATNAA